MLGLESPAIIVVYLLCIISALVCIVWGAVNWNRGDEEPSEEDVQWAEHEDVAEDKV